jgi:hypothetical protein
MAKYNINVDVGGTFTDGFFVYDGETQNRIEGAYASRGFFLSNEWEIPYVASPQSILEIARVFREFKPRERPLDSWSNVFQEVCNADKQSRGEL